MRFQRKYNPRRLKFIVTSNSPKSNFTMLLRQYLICAATAHSLHRRQRQHQEGHMARRTMTERLEQLDAQKRALQARFSKQERARDTRRKVLLGALVLQRLATSHDEAQIALLRMWLRKELPEFLVRTGDKELLADLFATNAPMAERATAFDAAVSLERPSSVPATSAQT
jgi:hypothetical protein